MNAYTSDVNTLVVEELRAKLVSAARETIGSGPHALLDFPNHGNVGDSAIWLGELQLLKALGAGRPAYVSVHKNCDFNALDRFTGSILLHGGGNFGDLWPRFHNFRLEVLRRFPGRPVIQLPQSIHFDGQAMFDETRRVISKHGAFTMFVRDEKSLEIAQGFDCEVRLAPDSAFMLDIQRSSPTSDVLFLRRKDKERAPIAAGELPANWTEADWVAEPATKWRRHKLRAFLSDLRGGLPRSDSVRETLYRNLAQERLARGIALLSTGHQVVTDRLHAHILSALMGINHYVLDNSYGKLSGFATTWGTTRPGTCGQLVGSVREAIEQAESIARQ